MKYQYKQKALAELESLAASVLVKYPKRVKDSYYVEIEGVLEDMGISLLPRPGIKKQKSLDAFLPRHPDYMVIDEDYGSDLPYFRLVIAEEISHRKLEPELWEQGVPAGANIYELDKDIYDSIEGDAYRMALALLMPQKSYIDLFNFHLDEANKTSPENNHDDKIKWAIEALSNDFDVTFNAVASRGNLLGLFKGGMQKKVLPGAVIF